MPTFTAESDDLRQLAKYGDRFAVHPGGVWALLDALERDATMDREAASRDAPAYEMAAPRIAAIPIAGPMVKGTSWWGTSTPAVRRAVKAAAADRKVDAIVLHIDSPGGMVAGTQELADAVAEARAVKPVHAYVSDMGASAAYWVASQAQTITANRTAEVGSIGVLAVVDDFSGAFEKMGVKVHVVSTGPYKGAGVLGAPVEDKHLAYVQERVDETMGYFRAAIAAGRPALSGKALDRVADGRVWGAAEAVDLGLIDGVGSFEDLVGRVAGEVQAARVRRQAAMTRAAVIRDGLAASE